MKAVLCTHHGPPEALVIDDVEAPDPGGGQVVIDVHAAAVNFPDTLIIQDKYQFKPALPFSPGGEVAGIVSAVGTNVQGLRIGDRVLAVMSWGGFVEQLAVDAQKVHRVPEGVALEQAAALVLTYGTAYYALKDRAQLRSDETVLVLGAAGGTGLAAVELAKRMGARVIAAASSEAKLQACRQRGADVLLNYGSSDFRTQLKAAMGDRRIDVVFDPIGGVHSEAALRDMAWGGRYLVVGFSSGDIPRIPLNLPLLKGCALVGVFFGAFMDRDPGGARALIAELLEMLAKGCIDPLVTGRYHLEDVAEALNAFVARQVVGKVVLTTACGRAALNKGN